MLAAGFGLALSSGARAAAEEPRVIYLNFSDGTETIVPGDQDHAPSNTSRLCTAVPFLRWPGGAGCGDREACKRAIAALVQQHWRDFSVVFVTRRPADGRPYVMVVVGPSSGTCAAAPGAAGIAPLDCGDRGPADVAFALGCSGVASTCAIAVSQEAAHTFGLAHVQNACDLMYAGESDCPERGFLDQPSSVDGPACGGGTQNSYQTLKQVLGSWPPGRPHPMDWEECRSGPPEVSIGAPRDGERVGPRFLVRSVVRSPCPLRSVRIEVLPGGLELESRAPPYEWMVGPLPAGDHVVRVTAMPADPAQTGADATVAVRVEEWEPCAMPLDCDGGSTCIDGFCKTPRPPSPPVGCACTAGAAGLPGVAAELFLGLTAAMVGRLLRRRRGCAR